MSVFDWIMSEGGPLLLVEEALAPSWMGVFGLSVPEVGMANDYDRACRDNDYIFPVAVQGGTAFSLGGGPLHSTFWRPQGDQLFLVQIEYGDDDEQCLDILQKLDPTIFDAPDKLTQMRCSTGSLVVFDSACSWSDPDRPIRATLKPGNYEICTRVYETDRFLFVLHRFGGR